MVTLNTYTGNVGVGGVLCGDIFSGDATIPIDNLLKLKKQEHNHFYCPHLSCQLVVGRLDEKNSFDFLEKTFFLYVLFHPDDCVKSNELF